VVPRNDAADGGGAARAGGGGSAPAVAGADVANPALPPGSAAIADPAVVRAAHLDALRARMQASPLDEPVALSAGVSFGPLGFVVGDRKTLRSAGISRPVVRTLTAAAEELAHLDNNPFEKTTTKARAAALEHLLPFLLKDTQRRGRPTQLSIRSRAASFALLFRLAEGMGTRGEAARKSALIDVLLDAAAAERHGGLGAQMRVALDGLPKKALTGSQLRLRNALVAEQVRPTEPPYADWFGGTKKPKLKVVQYVQDEFWKKELSTYKKKGWDVKVTSDKRAVATRVLEDPSGKHPAIKATVVLHQRDEAVFEAMADPEVNMVFYTGHAGVGGVASTSLEYQTASEGKKKFIGFFACRTKQNLDGMQRMYPDAHVLTSDRGTFGNDDRIVIHQLFDSISRREGYADIEKKSEAQDVWETNNYVFPNERMALEHKDLDGDGRVDLSGGRRDVLYNLPRRRGATNSISFRPSNKPGDPSELPGGKVTDAVQWFNSVHHYYASDYGEPSEKKMADQFRADGWFSSDDPDELVRVEKVSVPGKKSIWRVQVNAAYAHQDPHAVAMLVTWGMSEKLFADSRPDESDYDRRMRSLALVGSYLTNVQTYSDTGDLLTKSFAKRFGFPQNLSFQTLWSACMSDHDHEASAKVIDKIERGMQFPFLEVTPERSTVEFRRYIEKGLRELKKSDQPIARATFDLIATGQVTLDRLNDLSRPDFLRLRKEFARDGIDIDADDFHKLHDNRTGAMRAIRDSIHGYMWDDRIYVTEDMSPKNLARTLVHEVNHVLNKSEEHYRSKEAIFTEEYRAYMSEAMFDGKELTPERCRALKEAVIEDYLLDGLDPDDFPDTPPGRFFVDDPVADGAQA
jgi:hypothetical protein